jgi:hypothetical protein
MKSIACKTRSRTPWLALWTFCGMMAITSPAHAQWGGWGGWGGGGAGGGASQQKQLGTVLAVPTQGLGTFMAQNLMHQNNVNIVKISQFAIGGWNTQAAVVGVTQQNGAPAKSIWMPKSWVPFVQQVNNNKTIVEQTAVGGHNTQVAQVFVSQGNSATAPHGASYMFCPTWAAGPIVQMNNNVTSITQFALGSNNTQVAVVAVDQQNAAKLKVPRNAAGSLVQLNNNVTVVNQVAVGNNNTQVAEVAVSQGNG